MDQSDIFRLFRHFRGSGVWASKVLGVSKQTVSRWLMQAKASSRLDKEMPKLAALLEKTSGRCMEANGVSVRTKVRRLRSRSKRIK